MSGIHERALLLIEWPVGSLFQRVPRPRLLSLLVGELYIEQTCAVTMRRAAGSRGSGGADQAAMLMDIEFHAEQPQRNSTLKVKLGSNISRCVLLRLYNHWMSELKIAIHP